MKRNAKPVRARVFWAVSYGDGNIDPYSIRHKRSEAIDAFCDAPCMPDWQEWRKKGARPIKVLVAPNATNSADAKRSAGM